MTCSNPQAAFRSTTVLARAFVLAFLLGYATVPEIVSAQSRTEIIAQSGQTAPDGNGTFSSFIGGAINNSGQVAFQGNLAGTSGGSSDDVGIFRGGGDSLTQIVRAGQSAPDGNGTFSSVFSSFSPSLNNLGQVVFFAGLAGTSDGSGSGIFLGSGGSLTQIARRGQAAPDGDGWFSDFHNPSLNDLGQVAFRGSLSGSSNVGVFLGSGGSLTQIARRNQAAPDGNGTFATDFSDPRLNNFGQVAFRGNLTGTTSGVSEQGIFRGGDGSLTQIARAGQTAPDTNGVFASFSLLALNNSGQVAFRGTLTGTSGGIGELGIFRGNGGGLTQIARAGQVAPDGNGTFSNFFTPNLNDAGQVAFQATLTGTSSGNNEQGIFRGSGDSLAQIARVGQVAPDGNGTFSSFQGALTLGESGQAVFRGDLTGTSGGNNDNRGFFTGDGMDVLQVARRGDSLAGSTVTEVNLINTGSGGASPVNQFGQIAYRATLANGDQVVSRWTPDLHWRESFGGNWETAGAWTLGLAPAHVHDVFIDPESSMTVFGPNGDTSVRSLQIGGGTGAATLQMTNGTNLTASDRLLIASNGTITGQGTITGDVTSFGTISPGDSAGILSIAGNITLDSSSNLLIELGGLGIGQFDQLVVTGDLNLAGDLFVDLIDGHTLGFNQSYLIGEVGGLLSGQFIGLGEGDLVGNFGGVDLFISYAGGSGNSISLFTAVPEPSSGLLLMVSALIGLSRCRRRRN